MAKQRTGLGRGLNSLLGGPSEETARASFEYEPRHEVPKPERYTVSSDDDSDKKVAREYQKAEPAKKDVSENPAVSKKPADFSEGESLYTDNVENITIKGVREREVVAKPVERKHSDIDKKPVEKAVDEVDINSIEPNPDQPRTNFKREELKELAESIEKDGLLQPILVREMGNDRYQIIAGERRWQACRALGLKQVPVRIKAADDNRAIELALVENIQRSNLNPIEEAYGYRRMMERGNLTQSEVAQTVSKGRSTIANALRLLELPEDAQQLLFEEKITAGHARAILSIPTEEGRKKLTEKLVKEKLSVRETEALARLFSGKKNDSPSKRVPAPQSFKKVARVLRKTLNTGVRVKTVKGKNKIEIEFADEEELQRLFEAITANKTSSKPFKKPEVSEEAAETEAAAE